MRSIVDELAGLGPFPSTEEADEAKVGRIEDLLEQLEKPVSNEEARALVKLFGPDECFGLAWTLMHLIETAPDWPLWDVLVKTENENEWIGTLRERVW